MKYSVTGLQMKQIDQDTIQRIGIPSLVLMERAALAVADIAEKMLKQNGSGQKKAKAASVAIVCGTGNNGADGIAVGRILQGRGCKADVFLAGKQDCGTEEYQTQIRIARRFGVLLKEADEIQPHDYPVIVDALFGIGLTRNVEGAYQHLIERILREKRADASVVAVDIPSGIHAGTGAVMGTALAATVTVTFGWFKTGLLLYPGRTYAGQVQVADIGFPAQSPVRLGWDGMVLEIQDLVNLPRRKADSHKGSFGKMLLVAGCAGMGGAAYLSALAAYRVGAGLVKILTVPENYPMLQTNIPEAVVELFLPVQFMEQREAFHQKIKALCLWADAVVIGPGLGQEPYVEGLLEEVLSCVGVPVVVDADALNTLAVCPKLKKYINEKMVLTPHMGEMSRLTKQTVTELKADRMRAARDYAAETGAVCVLKDASTVIAGRDKKAYINTSGSSAMAKAGSGDVLAGIIGGLLAQGMKEQEAAAYGVYLHGLAGEAAAGAKGVRSVLARDIANHLKSALPA